MTKSLAASQKLMQGYLSELLTEDEVPAFKEKPQQPKETKALEGKKLEQLLKKVNVTEREKISETKTVKEERKQSVQEPSVTSQEITTAKSSAKLEKAKPKLYREGSFQAMFFDVAGLTIAVPLISLGGIHNADKTTSLMGKPDWFKGVMLHREEKINVVDTAKWVMPEKYNQKLEESLKYKYVIMLSNSQWGLLAESLVDTVTLQQEDVKWLDSPTKRPWLAGLVKDGMCALIEPDAFVNLLNDGFNVNNQ